ncbi:glycosyltransferase [Prevotella sp. E2-28]|uniref:glycosyltransferase n=1 Tax=Prevotella sp. E2-28 TaxID=2913620 RepID=UPI001EDC5AF3|nr:glycosyltransferase [Prevotella sp. E2-28]UKK52930.1 glycosyltransferase [Prevotella sp. E2-28]
MKIAYLFPHYAQKAGTERILTDKMNWLAQRGHEVFALSYEQGTHPYAFTLDEQVRKIDFNVRFFPLYKYNAAKRLLMLIILRRRLVKRLRKFVEKERPNLMVCTTYAPFEIEALTKICKPLGIPFIIECHSTYLNTRSETLTSLVMHQRRNLDSKQLAGAERVVVLTEGDAAEWRKVVKKVSVIPNMVHLNQSGLYSNCQNKKVIFAGRLEQQKGLPQLLQIWQKVHMAHPDWTLEVYGTGPQHDWFEKEVKRLDIGINMHEPTKAIMARYRECGMLMLTSVYEPFGLVLVEAMSSGLPVVSFDCPYGPAGIITDGRDGFLVPPGDIQTFADRLGQLMEDDDLRHAMSQRAIISSQHFSDVKMMPLWEQLFKEMGLPV